MSRSTHGCSGFHEPGFSVNDERDERDYRLTVRSRHGVRIRRWNYTAHLEREISKSWDFNSVVCSFVCLSIGTFVGWSISPMALRLFD